MPAKKPTRKRSEPTLLPCPFCGAAPRHSFGYGYFQIWCNHKHILVEAHAYTQRAAIANWNRRTP